MSLHLDWLAAHMQHSDRYAAWIHQQFHYEYADQPPLNGSANLPRAKAMVNGRA